MSINHVLKQISLPKKLTNFLLNVFLTISTLQIYSDFSLYTKLID